MTLNETIEICEEKSKEKIINLKFSDIPMTKEHYQEHIKNCNMYLQFAEWLKELKERRKKQEWTPCSEGLPSEDASVIVQYSDGSITVIEHARPSYWNYITTHRIVAWMPLPEPWEGADDETD